MTLADLETDGELVFVNNQVCQGCQAVHMHAAIPGLDLHILFGVAQRVADGAVFGARRMNGVMQSGNAFRVLKPVFGIHGLAVKHPPPFRLGSTPMKIQQLKRQQAMLLRDTPCVLIHGQGIDEAFPVAQQPLLCFIDFYRCFFGSGRVAVLHPRKAGRSELEQPLLKLIGRAYIVFVVIGNCLQQRFVLGLLPLLVEHDAGTGVGDIACAGLKVEVLNVLDGVGRLRDADGFTHHLV